MVCCVLSEPLWWSGSAERTESVGVDRNLTQDLFHSNIQCREDFT